MYIDTSALVKLYVDEADSEVCEAIVASRSLVSSRLLYCEFRSALLGKESRRIISQELRDEVWNRFESDISDGLIRFASLNDSVIQDAQELLSELHPRVSLRTLDAIHLATYLGLETGPLFTKDHRMLKAAAFLGLPLASQEDF
jgi:predicted nucleic acid-binding protein